MALKRISGLVVALKSIIEIFHMCNYVQRYYIAIFLKAEKSLDLIIDALIIPILIVINVLIIFIYVHSV